MTGSDDEPGDDGDEELDELAEPTAAFRTVQEREGGEVVTDSSGAADADGDAESELDELAEPVTEFRTAQEQEAAQPASTGDGDSDDDGCDDGDGDDGRGGWDA